MNQEIKISVIIPVYNSKTFLKECVNSVLTQTYQNFEVLLIDDGSTDGSSKICDDLEKIDKRIKVFHKGNEGVSSARNLGIEKAKGDYIAFVDSDDYLLSNYLNKLLYAIEITNSDIAFCYSKRFQNLNKIDEINCDETIFIKKNKTDIIKGLFSTTEHMAVWCKLYKSNLLKDIKFPLINNAEDVDFNSKVYIKAGKFVLVPEFLYYWRETPHSLTRSPFSVHNIDALECYLSAWENMPSENLYFQALSLQRLYKVILYTRYGCPFNFQPLLKKKIKKITKLTLHRFTFNKFIPLKLKIGLLLFYYIPLTYNFFRYKENNRAIKIKEK